MKWIVIIIPILLLGIVRAEYYADVTINVADNGLTTINGLTNHPLLLNETSELFTNKKANYWTVNLTINDNFSYYLYKIILPSGAVINYLKTPSLFRLSDESGRIVITSSGINQTINLLVQYTIERETNEIIIIIFLSIILVTILIVIKFITKKKKIFVDYESLTDRQKIILKIIEKKRTITQKELEKELDLPKSSLSRNIDSLARKGLIKKDAKGLTNLIRFVPPKSGKD